MSTDESDAPDFQRNNGRCMKCLKAKRPDNSPLVFCDQCPSAIHLICAKEHDIALGEATSEGNDSVAFPYLCYKCVQKRKMAERQKVVRQKREEEKLKKQERGEGTDLQDKGKDAPDRRKRVYAHRPPSARYPIEDLDLTDEDHRHKEELLNGPVLPEIHEQPEILLDALSICEFMTVFGSDLDERLVVLDLSVAEFMYSLCWPFDSPVLKNTYHALLKTAVHQLVSSCTGLQIFSTVSCR